MLRKSAHAAWGWGAVRRVRRAERDKSATTKYLSIEHLRFNTRHAAKPARPLLVNKI